MKDDRADKKENKIVQIKRERERESTLQNGKSWLYYDFKVFYMQDTSMLQSLL